MWIIAWIYILCHYYNKDKGENVLMWLLLFCMNSHLTCLRALKKSLEKSELVILPLNTGSLYYK